MRLVFVSVYTKVIFLCTEYIEKNLTPIRHKTAFEKFFFGSVQRAKAANPQKDACSSVINSVEYRFPYSALPISPLLLCLKATFVWRQHLMGVFAEMWSVLLTKAQHHNPKDNARPSERKLLLLFTLSVLVFFSPIKTSLCGSNVIYAIKEYVYWGGGTTGNSGWIDLAIKAQCADASIF